ncbi:hypothetical protein ACFFX0_01970 [Citricoccus parietis]|uniref:Uncharacterized protein n=1 Tax=Citricoccus parietis TaxID=592307 RepID=A0ABV5FTM8_9MICC
MDSTARSRAWAHSVICQLSPVTVRWNGKTCGKTAVPSTPQPSRTETNTRGSRPCCETPAARGPVVAVEPVLRRRAGSDKSPDG